jgi:hypothetical protein
MNRYRNLNLIQEDLLCKKELFLMLETTIQKKERQKMRMQPSEKMREIHTNTHVYYVTPKYLIHFFHFYCGKENFIFLVMFILLPKVYNKKIKNKISQIYQLCIGNKSR